MVEGGVAGRGAEEGGRGGSERDREEASRVTYRRNKCARVMLMANMVEEIRTRERRRRRWQRRRRRRLSLYGGGGEEEVEEERIRVPEGGTPRARGDRPIDSNAGDILRRTRTESRGTRGET